MYNFQCAYTLKLFWDTLNSNVKLMYFISQSRSPSLSLKWNRNIQCFHERKLSLLVQDKVSLTATNGWPVNRHLMKCSCDQRMRVTFWIITYLAAWWVLRFYVVVILETSLQQGFNDSYRDTWSRNEVMDLETRCHAPRYTISCTSRHEVMHLERWRHAPRDTRPCTAR